MGNIFSSEERLLRRQQEELMRGGSRHAAAFGYYQTSYPFERPIEHRYKKKRNVSFHGRYGKHDYYKSRSHSLNAILEELYSLGPEDVEGGRKTHFEHGGSLIPRIKLRRSTSSLKEEKGYKTLCKMSSESEIFVGGNSTNSAPNLILQTEGNDVNGNLPHGKISILLNDRNYDEYSGKSDENYFAKNFDDCMKRLQLIEKEHELIEKDDGELQFCVLRSDKEGDVDGGETGEVIYDYKSACEYKNLENGRVEEKTSEDETKPETQQEISEEAERVETVTISPGKEEDAKENEEDLSLSWYSSLKRQFEKKEQESQEQKAKEVSCRITGATLKAQSDKGKSEDEKKDTRHYFSRLMKTNKSLIDEELPDPDKVKHIRAMFQENLNSTLKRKLDKKLGGSLQNISAKPAEQQMSRPLSAQCCRNEGFCDTRNGQKTEEEKTTPKAPRESGEFQIENAKKKLFEKYEKDMKPGRDFKNRRILQPKWTDTGSVSSGISSDLSSYDTDLESFSREGTEQDEMTISDDDLLEEMKDKHYVQNEVLEKIRSFGTSVTYYGGEMITCSVGPLLSPTTQAIVEEIAEKYRQVKSPTRSFDEFYRKYVETNEPNRMKKLGRTRSFGQNDVFQKPNVLSNSEIEMYKNDLEIEIGIKKPAGIPQNTLKRKVTKSASLGCEPAEKPKQSNSEQTISPPELIGDSEKTEEAEDASPGSVGDEINNEATETAAAVKTPSPEVKVDEPEPTQIESPEVKEEDPPKPAFEPSYARSKSVPEGRTNLPNNPAKEIYFSYEKSIFNEKRTPDMEFEEFEVCETLSEKLEKLKKRSSLENSELSNGGSEKLPEDEAPVSGEGSETRKEDAPPSAGRPTEKKEPKFTTSRWPLETSVMVDIQKNNEQTPKLITSGKTVAKTKLRLF